MHLGVLRTRLLLPLSLTLDDAVRVLYVCCVSVIPSFVVGLRRTHRCASLGPPPLPSLQKHFPLPRSQTSKVSPFPPLCFGALDVLRVLPFNAEAWAPHIRVHVGSCVHNNPAALSLLFSPLLLYVCMCIHTHSTTTPCRFSQSPKRC